MKSYLQLVLLRGNDAMNSAHHTTKIIRDAFPGVNYLRGALGDDLGAFISDSRLQMMIEMAGGCTEDALKMAVSYILNTLDLLIRNYPEDAPAYEREISACRARLADVLTAYTVAPARQAV